MGASIEVFKMLDETTELRDRLEANTAYFKEGLRKAGLPFKDGESAIVPVMLGDAKLSQVMANALLEEGIYVIGFFYPVVPKGEAASACNSAQPTPKRTWTGRWPRLKRWAGTWAWWHEPARGGRGSGTCRGHGGLEVC